MAVQVDTTKCTGCGSCVEACSLEAVAVNDGTAAAGPELCVECGVCVDACPANAISLP
jgi:NAD-dependent dihydropyrimidine dehydrogenase PreA subunit